MSDNREHKDARAEDTATINKRDVTREDAIAAADAYGASYTAAMENRKKHRTVLSVLGFVVVIITTLALMLPAAGITKKVADETAGIELQESPANASLSAQAPAPAPEPEPEPAPAVAEEQAETAPASDNNSAAAADDPVDNNAGDVPDVDDNAGDVPDDNAASLAEADDSSSSASDDADDSDSAESADKAPAQTFKEELLDDRGNVKLTVTVKAPEGAFPEGTKMEINEIASDEIADKVEAAIQDDPALDGTIKSMTAVDIRFFDKDRNEIEPAKNVDVRITSAAVADIEDPVLVHVIDKDKESAQGKDTDAEVVKKVDVVDEKATDDTLEFKTNEFSPYVIVEMESITTQVITATGETYEVTVSYGPEAGVPEGAQLAVSEILEGDKADNSDMGYDEYVARAEEALGLESGSASYIRLFDIKIVDAAGEKVEIAAPVDVTIGLADKQDDADAQVVHFADGADTGDVVQDVDVDGDAVSFVADGFSAYAIVEGPEAIELGWNKLKSIDDLAAMGAQGLYIGQTGGYYFGNTIVNDGKNRLGIKKTKPNQAVPPTETAAKYYFESAGGDNQFYAYCYVGETKQYVFNGGNNSLSLVSEDQKTAFTVECNDGVFTFRNGQWFWNMQGGANGTRFCSYNQEGDPNNNMYLWYQDSISSDPYGLDGKSYGLMNWNGSVAGKALMAHASVENALDAKSLTVMSKKDKNKDKLFAPDDSEISMWTFEWIADDTYRLVAVVDGSTKYLRIDENGPSLVSTLDDNCVIQVVPAGTGIHEGEICLKAGGATLTYSGSVENGFTVGGEVGNEWLNLVNPSELTSDYFRPYSASKVSVSDPNVTNGSKVIVYTRKWNETKKKYEFFAIGSDGSLVPVYESGDSIEWVEGQVNTLLWNFVEYYWEDTTDPNYYYELYNQYSQKYIAPQVTGGQTLSDNTIGINLNGRRDGQYYTTILAWDEENYAYVGLKVEGDKVVACPKSEADDFYFAVMQDLNVDDSLTTVPTVDSAQYGITMKIKNFDTRKEMSDYLGSDAGGAVTTTVPGLLSTNLNSDGYPQAAGGSLAGFFSGESDVNHLFIESTFHATGYYEFDSAQNFASLKGATGGDFTVYKELGSYDSAGSRNTLKHGEFFPFNDLKPGFFTSVNTENLYSATGAELSNSDPRKHEKLYSIEYDGKKADCFFGMELEASFMQTPSGLDDWGHDIIFEFTGDDDFWLYVDGELVIDLGGIHSAIPGNVNFRTGAVNVNGKNTTLRALFESNYRKRNPGATSAEVAEFLKGYFDEGSTVFRDNTNHTMRIFYLERGAGASNLHMRFNLASIKPGTALLSKQLSGVDSSESVLAEFPYQIIYKTEDGQEHRLTNAIPGSATQNDDYVMYKDTVNPVTYKQSMEIGGITYNDVFLLKPNETAEISFPEGMTEYRVVECGVNTDVYDGVSVNGNPVDGTSGSGYPENRKDFGVDFATTDDRAMVNYVNNVDPDALRTLTITKNLFKEDGITPIHFKDDSTAFTFRLSLATEFDELDVANMHTYHVKDPDGYYCAWDKSQQVFVKIGEGISNYADLTAEQKAAASFTTSIYGTISKIPVDYTVEVRNVLAGTQFKVEERPAEIPDGYTFQKYIYNGVVSEAEAATGIEDVVVASEDPAITVCNLKGWGLRMNKSWTDADYMSQRETAYFAVYVKAADGDLTLVDGSVRALAFKANPQSVYWFWKTLPTSEKNFENYVVREVALTGANIQVDAEGVVTGWDDIKPVSDGGQISIEGTQKGETEMSVFEYTVTYEQGTIEEGSNVRVDKTTNNRPGIVLKKAQWNGKTPLAGATFTLVDDKDSDIGTFTSGDDGQITVAFLREGVDYKLTETKAPQGWHGLQTPMKIRLEGESLVVSGVETEYYKIDTTSSIPVLTVKDRPYTFQAIKKDGDTGEPLEDVKFALHRQVTVDGVTTIDVNPMPGYEELITDENGVVPGLDKTLPAGVYELREKETPSGYQTLSAYTQFEVSATGHVTLLKTHSVGVKLESSSESSDGTIQYVMTIPNYTPRNVSVWKTDLDHHAITTGAKFALYYAADYNDDAGAPKPGASSICVGTTNGSGILSLGQLASGEYRLVETAAPTGYNPPESAIKITVTQDSVTAIQGMGQAEVYHEGDKYYVDGQPAGTSQIRIWNSSGHVLPSTGGVGTVPFYAVGLILIVAAAIALFRRGIKAKN